jgi:hypothetical protein
VLHSRLHQPSYVPHHSSCLSTRVLALMTDAREQKVVGPGVYYYVKVVFFEFKGLKLAIK